MNVCLLDCHGSWQLVAGQSGPVQCGTCGFLVNDRVLIDAGVIRSRLYLEEQRHIRVVLLTDLHFDHIRELPTLADNSVGEIDEPIVIAAIPEVLDGLHKHIFIPWSGLPGFLPVARSRQAGLCDVSTSTRRRSVVRAGVTSIRVNHVVPTMSFSFARGRRRCCTAGTPIGRTDSGRWRRM